MIRIIILTRTVTHTTVIGAVDIGAAAIAADTTVAAAIAAADTIEAADIGVVADIAVAAVDSAVVVVARTAVEDIAKRSAAKVVD